MNRDEMRMRDVITMMGLLNLTQTQLAKIFLQTRASINLKVSGKRKFTLDEENQILEKLLEVHKAQSIFLEIQIAKNYERVNRVHRILKRCRVDLEDSKIRRAT